ncbi:unnamed protein product [Rhizoctonia solani]|uniref:Zn(2)-C6 fungal-type domain-containing protein n=1 Tax=Rhizoctonia solani TaxID=456999 RepID=A0A8H3ARA9_9AGAM|nr:unnamed protein product [Rhizoctonia solani]
MSYNQPGSNRDEPAPDEDVPLKIRRVTKACDLCRKRKARCDGEPASDRGKRGHESSQARELESRIIELEGLIRLIAPGIDIEQELEESANSDSPDNSSTLLRPSDSAFLQPNDAFLRPSADSTAAFFHPSGVMFDPYSHEEETKPDLTRLASSAPLSPARSSPGNTAMYSPPGTTLGRSTPSSDSANPYGIITPPGTATGQYTNTTARDRGTGLEGRPMGRSPYHTELSFTEGSEISIGLELAHAWKKEIQPQAARRNSRQVNPAEYQGSVSSCPSIWLKGYGQAKPRWTVY